jgi:hypothetical protein
MLYVSVNCRYQHIVSGFFLVMELCWIELRSDTRCTIRAGYIRAYFQ